MHHSQSSPCEIKTEQKEEKKTGWNSHDQIASFDQMNKLQLLQFDSNASSACFNSKIFTNLMCCKQLVRDQMGNDKLTKKKTNKNKSTERNKERWRKNKTL